MTPSDMNPNPSFFSPIPVLPLWHPSALNYCLSAIVDIPLDLALVTYMYLHYDISADKPRVRQ